MSRRELDLEVLPWRLAICRLSPESEPPPQALAGEFSAIVRTPQELSVVCMEDAAQEIDGAETGFRCLRVAGELDFGETGVLSSLADPLADEKISLFAVSTWDTDYLLVKDRHLEKALAALAEAGHRVLDS